MFRKTAEKIRYPEWAKKWPRYTRLDQFDRLLDGTFYDHLPNAFYDETDQAQKMIPLEERRPSAQFRLPRMVARWSARKLFAGRHRPKLRLKDKPKLMPLNGLLRRAKFWQKMAEAVLLGSVGSIAVTFRVEGKGKEARLALTLWRAKFCKPSFDEFGDLAQLRISFTAAGAGLLAFGLTTDIDDKPIKATAEYWFIRDYTTTDEITYVPVPKEDWNPVDGFVAESQPPKQLKPSTMVVTHGLGFVPGQWFVNLAGGNGIDGDCTWADAIPNSIELDYTLSQIGRGTRYNAAPQLVIVGELMNDDLTRSPSTVLQVKAGYKEDDGLTLGEGDAKLLEMSGTGTDAGLKLIDKLRAYALEQIAAVRKDPDKMKAPLSGRAMEYLDEESNDLVMDLRSQYGEDGALPLIKKIALATKMLGEQEVGALQLQWPRLFQPTPDELFALVQALAMAMDPLKTTQPGQPATPGKPAGATGAATPGTPAVPPTRPKPPKKAGAAPAAGDTGDAEQLLTADEARAYLLINMDIGMLDLESADSEEESVDDSPTPPDEPTEIIPSPLSIDENTPDGTPEGDEDQVALGSGSVTGESGTPTGAV
jgi:hypothetical protein